MEKVISELQRLAPDRTLSTKESLRLAEMQAYQLLKLASIVKPPVPDAIIAALPSIIVERMYPLPVSGSAKQAKDMWIILLNDGDPATRQRFTLAHEFKHILDNPFSEYIYHTDALKSHRMAERVCDHFAANLLMPHAWVRKYWHGDMTEVEELASYFHVSKKAMEVRLVKLGLAKYKPLTNRCYYDHQSLYFNRLSSRFSSLKEPV